LSLDGIWKSRGYGWILNISPKGYSLFDTIPGKCVEFECGSREDFDAGFELVDPPTEDYIRLSIRNDITHYEFDRITAMPANVLLLDQQRQPDPETNLDFFCRVFAQDYAFFNLRGVDWANLCEKAGARVSASTGPEDFFTVLYDLISPLRDNHVSLCDGSRSVNSEKMAELKQLIRKELGLKNSMLGDPDNVARIATFINREFLGGEAKLAGNSSFLWGMLDASVGYLNILKLFGIADSAEAKAACDLPPLKPDHARFLRDDLDAAESIMDQVLTDLGSADALVLDVRLNGGGFDCVGMAIANRFADRRRLAFTKHARQDSGCTRQQKFFIEPAGTRQFNRPVYLLTSARTASAGDVFALCMRNIPHVTLVGQPSTGILSDNLMKHLPNGWTTTISNEFYCSAEGQLFEGPGVPVDFLTPVFVEGDFSRGYHLAVEKACALARTGRSDRAHVTDRSQ